jgi:hypothetical protein
MLHAKALACITNAKQRIGLLFSAKLAGDASSLAEEWKERQTQSGAPPFAIPDWRHRPKLAATAKPMGSSANAPKRGNPAAVPLSTDKSKNGLIEISRERNRAANRS